MKAKIRILAAVLSVVAALMFAGCAEKPPEHPYGGMLDVVVMAHGEAVMDGTFNQLAYNYFREHQDRFNVTVKDEPDADADFSVLVDTVLKGKPDVVVLANSTSADVILDKAEANPEVKFVLNDYAGENLPVNVAALGYRGEEGAFLAGYTAASKAAVNRKIGFIGGVEMGAIAAKAAAFSNGTAYYNAEHADTGGFAPVTVLPAVYADTFSDKTLGKTLAATMYNAGADVIFQAAAVTGLGVIKAAEELDKLAIGIDYNQTGLAPDNVLASVIKDVGGALDKTVMAYFKNRAATGIFGVSHDYGLTDGIVAFETNTGLVSPSDYFRISVLSGLIILGGIDVNVGDNEPVRSF